MPLADDVDLDDMAARTEGYTGADLEDLVRRAGLLALRESLESKEVSRRLFEQALKETWAAVTSEMEEEYEQIVDSLKRESPSGAPRMGFLAARGT